MTIDAGAADKPIRPDLFGVFFEDLNYAADGGLYAELIQNHSFEYQATEMAVNTAVNTLDSPDVVKPETVAFAVGESFDYTASTCSLSAIHLQPGGTAE